MAMRRFQFHVDPLPSQSEAERVFSDPGRSRLRRFRRRAAALVAFFVVWIAVFFQSVEPLGSVVGNAGGLRTAAAAISETSGVLGGSGQQVYPAAGASAEIQCTPKDQPFSALADGGGATRVFAHVPVALEWSFLSLRRSCDTIDVLVPDWLTITEQPNGFGIETANADTRQPIEEHIASRRGTAPEVLPRIQVALRPLDSAFADKLAEDRLRAELVSGLKFALIAVDAEGACLDLSQFPTGSHVQTEAFVEAFASALGASDMQTCLIVSGNDQWWANGTIVDYADHVIVKLFYEPWVGSAPAPLSDNTWFVQTAQNAMQRVGSDRLVIALGNFAARWETGTPIPERLSYGQAMSMLAEHGAELTFNSDVSGSFATFRSRDGLRQKIWMQDAASAFNQLVELQDIGLTQVGIWSLGQEDPGLWSILNAEYLQTALDQPGLRATTIEDFVQYTGAGAALRVVQQPRMGFRSFDVNPQDGRIVRQIYDEYPTPYVIERYARTKKHELVLTFDDGPHPEFTSEILDILAEMQTPAAFFVLGQSVMNAPDVLQRIYDEGHEIGAHSFSHPRMDKISDSRTALEHDLTDRIIAGTVGHDTILYREPFLRSGGPISSDRIRPLETVQARGSIIYGMDVVPKDWMGLSSREIADYVIAEVENGNGNVILLHDGGDDRRASVEALPIIISELRDRGYVFRSIADVLGLNRQEVMPKADGVMPVFDKVSFALASGTLDGLILAFWFVLLVGLTRSGVILVLALFRRRHRALGTRPHPRVAVVVPAYNEEAAIRNCIESVRASDYPNIEIVVVDDGSADNTLNEIFEFKHKTNVRVISQPNQGKWSALNRALMSVDADIVVCIDADTQIRPDAISHLVDHFGDPDVGAVAGKIVVGNRVNLLTRLQALEYITAQNFDRRAFDSINGILVVPGAIGAWRVSALREVGLFCHDTMTEDSDVTIAINRAGYRIAYDERAVAYTEAPQSVRALMAQRLRWSLGMFQSAWKHKRAFREGRNIGLVSIPDMFIFGYMFPLLAPVADLLVIALVYSFFAGGWSGDVGATPGLISPDLLWAYLALPAIEFLIAAFAVLTDRSAKPGLLLLWPIQRIVYRPLLYLTVYRAVLRALSGSLAVWGGAKRQGHDLLLLEAPK